MKQKLIGSYRDLEETFRSIDKHYGRISGKLVRMIDNPRPWLIVSGGEKGRAG
jgi:hypothetical protein